MHFPSRQNNQTQNRITTGLRAPTGYKQSRVSGNQGQWDSLGVTERVITQQGITGMKTSMAGPRRKILSKSYFVVLLKQKISELTTEIAQMREESERVKKERDIQSQLESRHFMLSKEVRDLEGALADRNLALDKTRNGADPNDLLLICNHLSAQNSRVRSQVDALFLEKKNVEQKVSLMDQEVNAIKSLVQAQRKELSSADAEEFNELEKKIEISNQELAFKKEKIQEINKGLAEYEARMRLEPGRQKAITLKENYDKAVDNLAKAEIRLAECRLSFEDIRGNLMEKVKIEKNVITELEKRVKDLRKLSEKSAKKFEEMDEVSIKGLEILQAKEKDLDEYIKNYDKTREGLIKDINELEAKILKILEASAKYNRILKNIPDEGDIHNDRGQLMNEIQRKREDLVKIEEIETGLPERIGLLIEALDNLKQEISKFSKKEAENTFLKKKIKEMAVMKEYIANNSASLKESLSFAEIEYNSKLKKVERHEKFEAIENAKETLTETHMAKFSLNVEVSRLNEQNISGEHIKDISKLTDELNSLIIKSLQL